MTWVVPLALGGLALVVMAVFTMVAAHRRARVHGRPATQVGPRILVHDINDDRCTGCDACVAVCPTNVLDLIDNKSRVIRFGDCIQCEACMWACPTEALVMFPEGTQPPPLKIPEIDEFFQTSTPGQYLIGEVAGKPLVKNAANLGRMVVEHMLATGLKPGKRGKENEVDVAIVGSGPSGLSAALSCIQRGLSYVVLDKEQIIASTILRYPKGKLVMAEPYESPNLSLLPVFDSSKEQLIPIWKELIDRVGVTVRLGESVESVRKKSDGSFEVRTTVAEYRAQRVVLGIGNRGKPRTLGVAGENLPKVFNLLEDPDDWRGRGVLVVGGGDSAVEAALALADAGAKVLMSYRGRAFNRCQQKNRVTIESYAAQGRIKVKLMSQVVSFDERSVILQMADGGHKKYQNDAAFVLIGADPPIAWLEKLNVKFVERPHQYQLGMSDAVLRRLVPHAVECPEDAARAAAQVLGGTTDLDRQVAAIGLPSQTVSGPRKWLRAATSLVRGGTQSGKSGVAPLAQSRDKPRRGAPARGGRLEGGPVPLSEFAKRQRTGQGRRDQLSPGERTRVLRMLRDEGGRLADEDSQLILGAVTPPPANFDFDFEEDSGPIPPPPPGPLASPVPPGSRRVPEAKQAVIVGLAQAMAKGPANKRTKRPSEAPPEDNPPPMMLPPRRSAGSEPPSAAARGPLPGVRSKRTSQMPPPMPLPSSANAHDAPPPSSSRSTGARRAVPPPFSEEPTRQVDDGVLHSLRAGATPFDEDESTHHRLPDGDATRMAGTAPPDLFGNLTDDDDDLDFLPGTARRSANAVTGRIDLDRDVPDHSEPFARDDEATAMANIQGLVALERANRERGERGGPPPPPRGNGGRPPAPPPADETTRAIDIGRENRDGSLSDIDWDLD